MTTPLAILLVIAALLLIWIAWPLFRPAKNKGDLLDALQTERIDSLKRALADLKSQFEAGSIAEDDYERMERNTMLQLAKLYEQAGINPDAQEEPEPEVAEEEDPKIPCEACGTPLDPGFKFCPKCGAPQSAALPVA